MLNIFGSKKPAEPHKTNTQSESWFSRLRDGLSKTRAVLNTDVRALFSRHSTLDDAFYEELEALLIAGDVGIHAAGHILHALRKQAQEKKISEPAALHAELKSILVALLAPLAKPIDPGLAKPFVVMMVGVNGAGKTTTIGKLARHFQSRGLSVMLAAGDTFRAAAREQLAVWGERNGVAVMAQSGGDAAAIAFDAVQSATARRIDVVLVDTAGRLPTQLHLMEEIKKVKRVIAKAQAGAPHETLLVLDANTGQNGLAQVQAFDNALGLSGLIVTKLDGTAKGGMIAALAAQRPEKPIPVRFIGVGEAVEDLHSFSAEEFVDALFQ